MKCEHKGCEEEAEINICHNHINEDYPPDDTNIRREAKKEVFDDIKENCSIWDTSDIRGSSETKEGDKWLSMNIVEKLKKRHIS